MRISDTEYVCDRCGGDCGNGGVADCLVVSGLDPDNEKMVINFHFCRDRKEDDKTVKGCTDKILSARNLQHFRSTRKPTPKKETKSDA